LNFDVLGIDFLSWGGEEDVYKIAIKGEQFSNFFYPWDIFNNDKLTLMPD